MYMVTDLLLGGDLRFHLNEEGKFAEDRYESSGLMSENFELPYSLLGVLFSKERL